MRLLIHFYMRWLWDFGNFFFSNFFAHFCDFFAVFFFFYKTHLLKANYALLMFSPCAAWGDYFVVQSSFVWELNGLWDWAQRLKRTSRSEKSKEKSIQKRLCSEKKNKKCVFEPPWFYLRSPDSPLLDRGLFLRFEWMSFLLNNGLQVLLCTFSFSLERTLRLESETATRSNYS